MAKFMTSVDDKHDNKSTKAEDEKRRLSAGYQ
jgi:hypothetical protein